MEFLVEWAFGALIVVVGPLLTLLDLPGNAVHHGAKQLLPLQNIFSSSYFNSSLSINCISTLLFFVCKNNIFHED